MDEYLLHGFGKVFVHVFERVFASGRRTHRFNSSKHDGETGTFVCVPAQDEKQMDSSFYYQYAIGSNTRRIYEFYV